MPAQLSAGRAAIDRGKGKVLIGVFLRVCKLNHNWRVEMPAGGEMQGSMKTEGRLDIP